MAHSRADTRFKGVPPKYQSIRKILVSQPSQLDIKATYRHTHRSKTVLPVQCQDYFAAESSIAALLIQEPLPCEQSHKVDQQSSAKTLSIPAQAPADVMTCIIKLWRSYYRFNIESDWPPDHTALLSNRSNKLVQHTL